MILFSIEFLSLVGLNYFSQKPAAAPFSVFAEVSSLFSLLIAIFIFLIKSMDALNNFLESNETVQRSLEKHVPKIEPISIRTRISLKPYLLIIAVFLFLIALAFLIMASETSTSLQFFSLNFWSFFSSYAFSLLFLFGYSRCYKQEERATFLLDRFFREIDLCLRQPRIRLSVKDFKNALESYQKTLPDFYSLKNTEEKVRQTQLVLDRGTPQEIMELQLFVFSLSRSVKMNDVSSFTENFQNLCQFLETKENEEKKILQVNQTKKKKLWNLITKHRLPLGISFLSVTLVAYAISILSSTPFSDFAIEILGTTFAIFGIWETRNARTQ
jgi:uncharacterized membrane protein